MILCKIMAIIFQHNCGPLGPQEIDGLLVPTGKPYSLLTDHLNTGFLLMSVSSQTIHMYKPFVALMEMSYSKHLLHVMTSLFWVSPIK